MVKKSIYKGALFVLIPVVSVVLCRLLRVAQGEKNEEIVLGIMIGIVIDLVACFVLFQRKRLRSG